MKFNNKKVNFLDCTLRDGGYYNDCIFSREIIKSEFLLCFYTDGIKTMG